MCVCVGRGGHVSSVRLVGFVDSSSTEREVAELFTHPVFELLNQAAARKGG